MQWLPLSQFSDKETESGKEPGVEHRLLDFSWAVSPPYQGRSNSVLVHTCALFGFCVSLPCNESDLRVSAISDLYFPLASLRVKCWGTAFLLFDNYKCSASSHRWVPGSPAFCLFLEFQTHTVQWGLWPCRDRSWGHIKCATWFFKIWTTSLHWPLQLACMDSVYVSFFLLFFPPLYNISSTWKFFIT